MLSDTAFVCRLAVTAIKGFSLQQVEQIRIGTSGVFGDRACFLIDDSNTLLSATRTPAFLPYWSTLTADDDGEILTIGRDKSVEFSSRLKPGPATRGHFFGDRYVAGHLVPGPWSSWLSDVAGRPVRLVRADDMLGGYDVHPVTLMSEASGRVLGDEGSGSPMDLRRFRMTVTIDGVPPFAEDTWEGRTISVGETLIRVAGPVKRCAAIQRQPDGLHDTTNPLRRIKEVRGVGRSEFGRGLMLGVYGTVERSGTVRVGHRVSLPVA